MKIEPFEVEKWMDEHETTAKYNLAETCCASVSINELLSLSQMPVEPPMLLELDTKQDYGEIRGTAALRGNLAALYSAKAMARLRPDNVLVTPGAIAANHLLFYALLKPGDHVVCHYPTYQSLYSVPRSLGAEVDLWRATPDKQWTPQIEDLKALLRDDTKMIILNTPHNPTGAVLKKSLLNEIVELAREKGIMILSDEVYRPVFHGIGPMDAEFPPSVLSMSYDNVAVTGSMSKAYSLAGIRIGWLASRSQAVIDACVAARHYTSIAVSKLDQNVAAFALSSMTLHGLLGRNIKLARDNLALLEAFVARHSSSCEWVKPLAGTTAFVRFKRDGAPVDDVRFCEALQQSTGVMFLPGTCFGPEYTGYVRIGYVPAESVVRDGLKELESFMQQGFKDVPTV